MAITVRCDIVSSEQSFFSGLVERLVARGLAGELVIEPGHAALLTPLQPGPVRIVKQGGKEEILFVSGGYLEVQPNAIILLADSAVRAEKLDEEAALEAKKQAELAMHKQGELDYTKALSQLAEAAGKLRTIQQLKEKMGQR